MMGSVLPWKPEIRIETGDSAKMIIWCAISEHRPKQTERSRVGDRTGSAQPEAASEACAAHAERPEDE